MSEQDGIQSSTKQRRSRKTNNDNHQNDKQAPAPQRPANDDTEGWKAYWKAQGLPWRTEPEIDAERQKYLTERRAIVLDMEQGIYPFKDIEPKLSRADIEWLLATHENGRGPIDWSDTTQRKRDGLDLRGSNLQGIDLHNLPLARVCGGVRGEDWVATTREQRHMAAVHWEGCDLRWAHLEGSTFTYAHLEGADLRDARLEGADLNRAILCQKKNGKSFVADLRKAFFDAETVFRYITLWDENGVAIRLADVHWGEVGLATIDWASVKILGEEYEAKQDMIVGRLSIAESKLTRYQTATRANRQLAVVLQNQGLNEEADQFAYRAQLLQRKVYWHQHEFGRWLFSMLLALLSGYGYRIWRILAAYVVMVSLFALVYFVFGRYYPPHLPLHQAFLESITAFHGRVFLEPFNPDTPQIWFTALEAIAGLILEGVFIAMLIQRFFGK
jgi:hypothetical protein